MEITDQVPESGKLPLSAHLWSAWPLVFVPFCGAIGLVYFALAYLINLKVFTSDLSKMNKVLAIIMSGMSAMSGWWFTAQWLQQHVLK
ncbi:MULTISPECIES: hypothetical protein [Acinetobacter]|uniref:hypothetical protein n=1 Tax=Acinetobacter TaxID=469 RepID=UPI0005388CB7|nr:hypothetical protein [Acinetobacter sp. HR7]KGT47933.1 hypothetical protein GW12_10210 [Acinetobacter sp. HR7]